MVRRFEANDSGFVRMDTSCSSSGLSLASEPRRFSFPARRPIMGLLGLSSASLPSSSTVSIGFGLCCALVEFTAMQASLGPWSSGTLDIRVESPFLSRSSCDSTLATEGLWSRSVWLSSSSTRSMTGPDECRRRFRGLCSFSTRVGELNGCRERVEC